MFKETLFAIQTLKKHVLGVLNTIIDDVIVCTKRT